MADPENIVQIKITLIPGFSRWTILPSEFGNGMNLSLGSGWKPSLGSLEKSV